MCIWVVYIPLQVSAQYFLYVYVVINSRLLFVYSGHAKLILESEDKSNVVALAFNSNATLLLCLAQNKQLTVYGINTENGITCDKLAAREILRNAAGLAVAKLLAPAENKMIYEAVIVAEKTGEVTAFPLPDVAQHKGVSLMAHTTSIVTDLVCCR